MTAAARAVEQLAQVMLETEAVPTRTATLVSSVTTAFDAQGAPASPVLGATLAVMLDDLAWLGRALQAARASGQQPPPRRGSARSPCSTADLVSFAPPQCV